jgi:hypothetical protein
MQTKPHLLSFAIKAGLCAVLALVLGAQAQDQDKKAASAEYWNVGVWNGNGPGASGGVDSKMQLHLNSGGAKRDRLYGYVTEWTHLGDPIGTGIYEGKIIGDEVSFTVENVLSKTTLKYKGKITGDAIKGTVEITRGGETTTRNWTARREKKKRAFG